MITDINIKGLVKDDIDDDQNAMKSLTKIASKPDKFTKLLPFNS